MFLNKITSSSFGAHGMLALTALALIVSVILRGYKTRQAQKGLLPLPPSPPRTSVVTGHLPLVLKAAKENRQHLLFGQWARQYGEIFYVNLGAFQEYFINSDRAVKAIFDKSATQTSERPRWIVSNEHICNGLNPLLVSASEKSWKHQRKATALGLTSVPLADAGLPFLHFESLKFLMDIASNPEKGSDSRAVHSSIGRYTYSTFASQIFGLDVPHDDNPAIEYIFETGIAQIFGILPGYYLVDTFEFLDYLPLFLKPWEKQGRARFKRDYEWTREKLERVKRLMACGEAPPHLTFLRRVLEDPNHLGFDNVEDAAYLGLMLVIGASDTSRVSTWSFLEAMISFPDVCEKARNLLEEAVGDMVPVFEDLKSVPYIRQVMKEVWRWRPPVALGHPHMTAREVIYEGKRIPKGSRIHLNAWAIHHDPERYPQPERFMPERFEEDLTTSQESAASPDVSKRDHFAFGAGRRICPGYHVADRSFAVSIMRILWAFDITVRPGTKMPLDPGEFPGDMPGTAGVNLPVVLTVRSPQRLALITKTYEEAVARRPRMEPLMV